MRSVKKAMLTLAVVALAVSFMAAPAAAKTWKVTVAAGHPPVFVFISAIHDHFIPYVNEKLAPLGHKIEWKEAYGGTLVKVGGELKALEAGIVEMCNISTLFEAAKMPLHSVCFYAPFGSNSIDVINDTMIELRGKIPAVRDEWAKHNMFPLGNSATDTYNLFSKFPVKTAEDIKGRKIGTGGSMAAWLKGTGGISVSTNLPEAYNSIQLGVYDAYIIFNSAAMGLKLHEVAPNVTVCNFGAMYGGAFGVNKKFFESLPPEVQKVLVDGGNFYTKKYGELATAKAAGATEAMKKGGATLIQMSDEERAKWARKMPNLASEWVAAMEQKGLPGKQVLKAYLDVLRSLGVKLVRDWDKE